MATARTAVAAMLLAAGCASAPPPARLELTSGRRSVTIGAAIPDAGKFLMEAWR